MRKKYGTLILVLLALLGCSNSNEDAKKSETYLQLSNYSLAAEFFVTEYGKFPDFATPREFLDVMSEKNRKKIAFYSITDGELGADGQPIDAFGNPIKIEMESNQILFRSAGSNGIFESGNDSDDIEVIFKKKA